MIALQSYRVAFINKGKFRVLQSRPINLNLPAFAQITKIATRTTVDAAIPACNIQQHCMNYRTQHRMLSIVDIQEHCCGNQLRHATMIHHTGIPQRIGGSLC